MNRRTLAVQQLGAAAAVVLVLALAGGGRYPLWVDLAVYAAGAGMAAVGVAQLHQAADERKRRHPADPMDEPAYLTRAQALTEAADWVITARPREDPTGRTLTPGMVQSEAWHRSGHDVTEAEAAAALHARLVFRGYRAPGEDPRTPM